MTGPGGQNRDASSLPHAEARRSYDRLSRWYDLLAGRAERPARQAGLALLAPAPGETVLELGPGTGHDLAALARAVGPAGRVAAVELSGGMLAVARRRLGRRPPAAPLALLHGDALRLPVATACCHAVQAAFVLELFPDAELPLLLAEVRRVLRPDGRLGAVALADRGPRGSMRRLYDWAHRRFPSLVDCRPIPVREILATAGLRVTGVAELSLWGLPVDALVARRA